MSGVNGTNLYLFIAQNFGSAEDMVNAMDANSDGVLTKKEFSNYLNTNFSGVTPNEISQMWNLMDTQKGANKVNGTKNKDLNSLNNKELENINKQVAAWEIVNDYIQSLQVPAGLSGVSAADFKASVLESIQNSIAQFINSNLGGSDIEALKNQIKTKIENEWGPKAEAKTAANLYAHSYIKSAINRNAELRALGWKGDDQIEALISAYINSDSINLANVKSDIERIVDAYLASAGFSAMPTDMTGVEDFVYSGSDMNGLQISVITKKINGALGYAGNEFGNYQDVVQDYIQRFLNETLSGGDFNTVNEMSDAEIKSAFQNSKYYEALNVLKNYMDISAPTITGTLPRITDLPNGLNLPNDLTLPGRRIIGSIVIPNGNNNLSSAGEALYEALKNNAAIGKDLADAIASQDFESSIWQNIIKSVADKVANGEINASDVIDEIVKQVLANKNELSKQIGYTSETYSNVSGISSLYEAIQNSTTKEEAKALAIKYIEALLALENDELTKFINENGYLSQLENGDYTTAGIKALINEIKAKYEAVNPLDLSNLSVLFVDNYSGAKLNPGEAKTLDFSATVMNGNDVVNNSYNNRITYSLNSVQGGTATINPETGKVTLKANDAPGNIYLSVSVMVNGKVVGDIQVTMVISANNKIDWESLNDSEFTAYKMNGSNGKYGNLSKMNLVDAYKNNICVSVNGTKGFSTSNNKGTYKTEVNNFINILYNSCLSSCNYDEDALKTAKDKTIELYEGMIDRLYKYGNTNKSNTVHYTYDGKTYASHQQKYASEGSAQHVPTDQDANNFELGLSYNISKNPPTTYQMQLNLKCLMDIFQSFYEAALK